MPTSNRLVLPLLDAAQAQKHVTHNEALAALDALVHLSVSARNVTAPPAAPAEGDRVLVGSGATGAFAGHDGALAALDNGGWAFFTPRAGWRLHVAAENALMVFDGTAWAAFSTLIRTVQNLTGVGIGASSDGTNKLAAKLNGVLFTALGTGEGGTGDLRLTLNKSAAGNTVSQLYQSNYSGRAETGLTGDDRFHVKVSADGTTWKEALTIDPATGLVGTPQGRTHVASGRALSECLFTPGGDGQVSFYRCNRTGRNGTPRTATVSSASGTTLTLATADANLFFESLMAGVSLVRIWNTSKTPAVSAWVGAMVDPSRLSVFSAASIAGWSAGETVQLGDPSSVTPSGAVAIDISPMMQTQLGAVFPQKGVLAKLQIGASLSPTAGVAAGVISMSGTGLGGSFAVLTMPSDGSATTGQVTIPCSVPSPVSNANLVFLRETAAVAGTLGLGLGSVNAIYA